jgi:MFS family permease
MAHEQSSNSLDAGLTRNQAFRTTSFWLLAAAVMGITLCQAGPHIHMVSFFNDIGYSPTYASFITSTYMFLLTGYKVAMGFVFDRLGSMKGSLLIVGCCVLAPMIALFAAYPAAPWIFALVLALAASGSTVLGTILTANYFGRKDYARIYSIISMFSYIGVSISSPLLGTIYDATGSYSSAWVLIIAIGSAVCICLLGAYRTSKKIVLTDINPVL